jgi:protein-L-isoaspartate(D-aspartate) O-methyltransferase
MCGNPRSARGNVSLAHILNGGFHPKKADYGYAQRGTQIAQIASKARHSGCDRRSRDDLLIPVQLRNRIVQIHANGAKMRATTSVLAELRRQMVEDQLRGRGIVDSRVLAAMSRVPREEFVPDALRNNAYHDSALPIGYQQTISQPYTVAFMCEAAQLEGPEKVLEIGTGSGYGAAVLGELTSQVETLERIEPLVEEARGRLKRLGYNHVTVHCENGVRGFALQAPYDAILVTAGAETLPPAYVDQLADGGRLVIPLGSHGLGQTMYCFIKQDGQLIAENLGAFSFVPLIGE